MMMMTREMVVAKENDNNADDDDDVDDDVDDDDGDGDGGCSGGDHGDEEHEGSGDDGRGKTGHKVAVMLMVKSGTQVRKILAGASM